MPSTRRTFLASLGTTVSASFAGCAGTGRDPLPVSDLAIGQSFEWLQAGVHWQGVTLTDRQYVFVDIPPTADITDRAAVSLVLDDQVVEPSRSIGGVETTNIAWRSDSDGLKPRFTLPLTVASDSIQVRAADGRSYDLSDEQVTRLQEPPRLTVKSFESAGMDGEDLRVDIAIENAGGHDATFRGNLGSASLSGRERVDFPVAAGETKTVTRSVNLFSSEGMETIRFEWGVDSREIAVEATG